MLTDPKLKSQVDALWDKLWTGGLSNPLDAIEQFSYLLFMKRLDEEEDRREKRAKMLSVGAGSSRPDAGSPRPYTPHLKKDLRWRYWTQLKADDALKHVKERCSPRSKTWAARIVRSSSICRTPSSKLASPRSSSKHAN